MNNWYLFFHKEISTSLYALLFKRNGITMKSNVVEKFNQDSPLVAKESPGKKKPKLDWAGGLKELRNEHMSFELQEKVSDWIVESALSKPTQKRKEPAEVLK